MIKRNFYKRLERLEALVVPDTRAPELMTIGFVDAEVCHRRPTLRPGT